MTDQLQHSETDSDLTTQVPWHARPDGLAGRIAGLLAIGWTRQQVAATLAATSWAGRGPGYTVRLLQGMAAEGPRGWQSPAPASHAPRHRAGDGARGSQPASWTTSPGLRELGLGRPALSHPYTDADGYCVTCQLPTANARHGW